MKNRPAPLDRSAHDSSALRDKLLNAIHELGLIRPLAPEWVLRMKALTDDEFTFLAESIDDSDYSMHEWLMALVEFENWLVTHGRPANELTIRSQVEYLNCCVQGAAQGGGRLLSLKDLFLDYARTYGVAAGQLK